MSFNFATVCLYFPLLCFLMDVEPAAQSRGSGRCRSGSAFCQEERAAVGPHVGQGARTRALGSWPVERLSSAEGLSLPPPSLRPGLASQRTSCGKRPIRLHTGSRVQMRRRAGLVCLGWGEVRGGLLHIPSLTAFLGRKDLRGCAPGSCAVFCF